MEVLKGAYVKPTKLTVGDLLDDYHARYVAVKYVPRSAQAYRYNIDSRLKPVLGSVVLSSLTWHQIEDFRDGLSADGMKATSVNQLLALLKRCLRWGVKRELVAVNVGDKVSDLPTSRRKKTVDYSVEHFKKLKEVFSGTELELELVVIIGLYTGLRKGEVLDLWWDDFDFDFETGTINVRRGLAHMTKVGPYWSLPKTESSVRVIPVTAGLLSVVENQFRALEKEFGVEEADSDSVFFDPMFVPEQVCSWADDHRLLSLLSFDHRYRRGLEAAEISGLVFHDLLHHFATALQHLGLTRRRRAS